MTSKGTIAATLQKRRPEILAKWLKQLEQASASVKGRLSSADLKQQAGEFLGAFTAAAQTDDLGNIGASGWQPVRAFLEDLSRQRAIAGFSSDETATFIFSLKRPVFDALREESGSDVAALSEALWAATELLDKLGLHTIKAFQSSREQVIARQQVELLELSTPVVKLWDGILAL